MTKYAFFDVDNTIYDGYTARDFIEFAVAKNKIPARFWAEYRELSKAYKSQSSSYNDIVQLGLDLISRSVAGKCEDAINNLVTELLSNKKNMFFSWVRPVLQNLKAKGYKIILISAGPDFIIMPIASRIGADKAFATSISKTSDLFSGEPTQILNGTEKVKILKSLVTTTNSQSVGFGDSIGDVPLLENVYQGFVHKTDRHPEMAKIAKKEGWVIFSNEEPILKKLEDF